MRCIGNLKLDQWRNLFIKSKPSIMQSLNIFRHQEGFCFLFQNLGDYEIKEKFQIRVGPHVSGPFFLLTARASTGPASTHHVAGCHPVTAPPCGEVPALVDATAPRGRQFIPSRVGWQTSSSTISLPPRPRPLTAFFSALPPPCLANAGHFHCVSVPSDRTKKSSSTPYPSNTDFPLKSLATEVGQ
jgi:hypothetical protein